MLNIYRRHLKKCPHRGEGEGKGRAYTKCSCPIWADGDRDGKQYRKSLHTRDWQRALRRAERMERPNSERDDLTPCSQPGCTIRVEAGRCERHTRSIPAAIASYQHAKHDLAHETKQRQGRILRLLGQFTGARRLEAVDGIGLEDLTAFRASRNIGVGTWVKELETLRQFFRYCEDAEWIVKNWAQKIPTPRNIQPSTREPYEPNEVARIVAACDVIGRAR